jgi:hypothetical protein
MALGMAQGIEDCNPLYLAKAEVANEGFLCHVHVPFVACNDENANILKMFNDEFNGTAKQSFGTIEFKVTTLSTGTMNQIKRILDDIAKMYEECTVNDADSGATKPQYTVYTLPGSGRTWGDVHLPLYCVAKKQDIDKRERDHWERLRQVSRVISSAV